MGISSAVLLAKTFGGSITLVHVLQPPHESNGPSTNDALGWELTRQAARAYLFRLEQEVSLALGEPVDVRLEQGRPAERIVDVAKDIEADLTVLGSRGEGGARACNLGSTVQQVLAMAHGSLFVVHPSSVAPAVMTLKRLLVPLDGSMRTESVLPIAARIARVNGAEMLLVHVVQEPQPTALLRADNDMNLAIELAGRLETSAKSYLERLRQQLTYDGMTVRTLVVRHANEQQCLLEISQQEQTDLIVLSAHGSACDSTRSFGSVATHLLTRSTVPLLVLQDLPTCELPPLNDVASKHTPTALRASYAPENV